LPHFEPVNVKVNLVSVTGIYHIQEKTVNDSRGYTKKSVDFFSTYNT